MSSYDGEAIEVLTMSGDTLAQLTKTHFSLLDAVLCVECEAVFESGPDRCPSCMCGTFFYISSVLKTNQLREEIDEARTVKCTA